MVWLKHKRLQPENIIAKRSKAYNNRYILIEKCSGVIIADADGLGYSSTKAAHSAYRFAIKNENLQNEIALLNYWLSEHKDFFEALIKAEKEKYASKGKPMTPEEIQQFADSKDVCLPLEPAVFLRTVKLNLTRIRIDKYKF